MVRDRKEIGMICRLSTRKILVIGDLMLDTYTIGKASRISPEAPVAVIQVLREESRPGGAGNVILNLRSLGAQVAVISRIGTDSSSDSLREALIEEKVDTTGLFVQHGYSTPLKNRVIADNQQIVRVDHERVTPLPEMLEQQIIESLPAHMEGIEAVAISDYGKGFLSKTLLNAIIEQAKSRNIPLITDPKGVDFNKYFGTTVIKPNLSEAYAAAGLLPDASLDLAAQRILELTNAQTLMVTRSESGISIFHQNGEREDFPVRAHEIKDVTGAGDTVLAMLTYAAANGFTIAEAAQLCNVAAGIAIERFGCARVSLSDLARRLLEINVKNKVFEEEHLFALQEALKEREYIILGLSESEGMTPFVFSTIHRLAKNKEQDLVIFLRRSAQDEDFVEILSALHDVKFVVVQSELATDLFKLVLPAETYVLTGKTLSQLTSPPDLLALSKDLG